MTDRNVKDLMNKTAKDFMIAKIKLSRVVVNNGDFHQLLDNRQETQL